MSTASRLIDEIKRLGGKPNPPASLSAIAAAEQRLHCTFPDAIKDFYLLANGFSDATSDWIWDFFDLDRLVDLYSYRLGRNETFSSGSEVLLSAKSLICFCDVLIDAPTYIFCADSTSHEFGKIYADENVDGWLVASTFSEFTEIFIESSDEILLGFK